VSDGSIAITGDLMVRTPGITARYEGDAGFQAVLRELRRSTVAVANLEIPLSCRGYVVPKTYTLRAEPAVMADIETLGLSAVTLANNHIMDYGPDALADTLAACQRAGLAHCGAGENLDAALAPLWLTIAGQRIALLNVACTLPPESEALPDRPGVAPLRVRFAFEIDANLLTEQPGTMPKVSSWAVAEDQARVAGMIATCREQGAAAVIVVIHWGSPAWWLSPYQGLLCAYQRPLAQALIEAGADAICGHHPHQLHPVEVYRGKPILYSLGNFIFEGVGEFPFMEPEAVIARLSFGEHPTCDLIPLLLDEEGFPSLATGVAAERVIEKLRNLSRPYGTEIVMSDGVATVVLA
jgi:poly-gamma-glutamate capsule biosynthesis protein CapA/YwtB (metallophosphatase superfamily)